MLHLNYERKGFRDFVTDETGQIWFPWATQCEYDVEKKDWPRWVGYFMEDENTLIKVRGDKVKLQKDGVKFNNKWLVPFDCCCKYTGVVDINGKPIYTKDYVKIDELGWTGFVYQDRDMHGICVEGIGGFSDCPYLIERLGNPVLGETSPWLEKHLIAVEKDFMMHQSIPLNTPLNFNIFSSRLR